MWREDIAFACLVVVMCLMPLGHLRRASPLSPSNCDSAVNKCRCTTPNDYPSLPDPGRHHTMSATCDIVESHGDTSDLSPHVTQQLPSPSMGAHCTEFEDYCAFARGMFLIGLRMCLPKASRSD
ncbi:uncharacterized protein B0T23DRAFT_4055 [Neurospora hispaniola]|uniref:Secreted protein n=1 Tax=Neurospora hispaniola TaxID=588809 RepID=A0AAJ0IEX2_9PEZI|nr:hypothetical protein B0T23DRAFT_4055 [Neurospora hispaniola]